MRAVETTEPTTASPVDQTWKKVVPGSDCECADGSEFAFWERRADPTKVVFSLDGGGARLTHGSPAGQQTGSRRLKRLGSTMRS